MYVCESVVLWKDTYLAWAFRFSAAHLDLNNITDGKFVTVVFNLCLIFMETIYCYDYAILQTYF